jgi:predicted MPP superfamily phosphohydrolase
VKRRTALAALATAGVAVAGHALLLAPERVHVTRHRLRSAAARAGPRDRVRLVQLSDLHLHRLDAHGRRVADAVAAARPDVVLLTGDAVERTDALEPLARFLDLLDPATPKLAILGNWEHWGHVDLAALAATYAARNGRLLRNESARLRVRDAELLVTGLDDLIAGRPDLHGAVAGAAPCPNHLLLAHCPAQRDRLPASWGGVPAPRPVPLPATDGLAGDAEALPPPVAVLSGHTHGGQLAPFGVPLWRPPGSGPYVRGWYRDAGVPLYVSVGIGTSGVPARLGAAPEVAVFEWEVA